MTSLAVTLYLAWRDPARNLALIVGIIAVLLFIVMMPANPYWVALLIGPAFLIGTALALPTFSAFERAMPVTVSQLLWSRILASLGPVWISLLLGVSIMLYAQEPLSKAREPVECAACFTACVCLATLARLASRPTIERIWALLALASAVLTLLYLTPVAAAILTGAAGVPVAARYWWVYAPEWDRPASHRVAGRAIWPLFRMLFSRRMLLLIPLAFWFGMDRSWSLIPFVGILLDPASVKSRYIFGLPISRRWILWASLAPIVVPFLAGAACRARFHTADRIANFTQPSAQAAPRELYGNPPGLTVPTYCYRISPLPDPPPVVAPWGESAQIKGRPIIAVGPAEFAYNPYLVAPENSDRFFEWQYSRATREIYGAPFRPQELRAAIRDGLKPIGERPRMLMLRMALGAGLLLLMALLYGASQWRRFGLVPYRLRASLPFLAPCTAVVGLALFAPYTLPDLIERFLLHLSTLMTVALLAALPLLYWALETVVNQMEFIDKPKEAA
jgi:hypothetical protein